MKDYVAALDLQAQRAAAAKIQNLLLDETPNIYAYFYFLPHGDEEERRERGGVRDGALRHHQGRVHARRPDDDRRGPA